MSEQGFGPHFANVVQLVGMTGGNSSLVNGFYIPLSSRKFSFPVYAKFCERTNTSTSTELSLHYQNRRYYWVVRDRESKIVARVSYSASIPSPLSLPEHVPDTRCWELLSTGFFGNYKRKPAAHIRVCNDDAILQHMSSFIDGGNGHIGSNGHIDSVSESIRYIDETLRDLASILNSGQSQPAGSVNNSSTFDEETSGYSVDDLSLDEIIELYSDEIFNGYGSLLPHDEDRVPFVALQDSLEKQVSQSLASFLDREKELSILSDRAPEEFIDPITMIIMQQPMKIPTSPYILDRKTLAAHLAVNATDPFSRRPLTMDMVIPHVDLQIRIESWLQTNGVAV